jgi:tryptophanyl-tRNA synthetase
MTSDILMYQASFVPVGEDQVAHVEITREIARRFNQFYPRRNFESRGPIVSIPSSKEPVGANKLLTQISDRQKHFQVFPEPQPLLTPAAKLPGTDGRKMSKSYGNGLLMSDAEPVLRQKLKTMVTDPARVRRTDAGDPAKCPVFDLHKIFSSQEKQAEVRLGCTTAGIGCIQCKTWVADNLVTVLAPIQERRREYEENPRRAWDILEAGSVRARKAADETLVEVRESMHMGLNYEAPAKGSV